MLANHESQILKITKNSKTTGMKQLEMRKLKVLNKINEHLVKLLK